MTGLRLESSMPCGKGRRLTLVLQLQALELQIGDELTRHRRAGVAADPSGRRRGGGGALEAAEDASSSSDKSCVVNTTSSNGDSGWRGGGGDVAGKVLRGKRSDDGGAGVGAAAKTPASEARSVGALGKDG